MTNPVKSRSVPSPSDMTRAARRGDSQALVELLKAGADVDGVDERNETALYAAAELGCKECLKVLLHAGAKVNRRVGGLTQSNGFVTALNRAVHSANYPAATFLLQNGADPRVADGQGNTALHLAVSLRGSDIDTPDKRAARDQLMQLIVARHCPVSQQNEQQDTALHIAISSGAPSSTVEALLTLKADPEIMSRSGRRALHHDWSEKSAPVVRALIAAGADVNGRDSRGRSPLFYALSESVIGEFITAGADPRALDNEGRNALTMQVYREAFVAVPVAVALMDLGLAPTQKDYAGADAVDLLKRLSEKGMPNPAIENLFAANAARIAMLQSAGRTRHALG